MHEFLDGARRVLVHARRRHLIFAETSGGTRLRWDRHMRLVGPMRVCTPVLMLIGPRWERRNWIDLKTYLEDRSR